jgi:hypothetical protein
MDLDIAVVSDPVAVRVADIEAEAARLELAGATVLQRVSDHGHFHVGMRDPRATSSTSTER